MANVQFNDNSVEVKAALDAACIAYLYEAAGALEAQTKRNQTRIDTAETKNAWTYTVNEAKGEAVVGNPLQNAIWEEFGTGEYALNHNGRRDAWVYQDARGEWHKTTGKTPLRPLHKAFKKLKPKLMKRAEQVLKARMQ